ncbi:MAG: ABC transporter permease [Candidatus Pristimantibacillus lignocellulolyticus]|uniref:ABC transporter permease n=1 Tax=Candidatus Pristimantibacillus lignocellulolyticus TaxID=2994561 RepID=A0A9J6ZJJ2_9BACL|nr:MAG: ABC transporter permease [Candidatus Pristimantibacillus lignocellulolyticus]
MISSIKGLAYRFLMGNKTSSLSSLLSIVISITLIISMVMFVTNERQSFQDQMKNLYGDMDMLVGYDLEHHKIIDETMLKEIHNVDNNMTISPVLLTNTKVESIKDSIYTVGLMNDDLVKSRYKLSTNLDSNGVAMNESLTTALQLEIGHTVNIDGLQFKLQVITADVPGARLDMVLLPHEVVKDMIYNKQGVVNEANFVLVQLAQKNLSDVVSSLKSIDSQLRIDVVEQDEFYEQNLQAMNVFIIVMSLLILLVSILFIISNSEAFLYKYRKQMAVMRCIGATNKQLFRLIWLQLSFIVIIGGLLAFLLAWSIHIFAPQLIGNMFSYESEVSFHMGKALITTVAAMIFIQLFMIIPAYSSNKILPMQLMSTNEHNASKLSKRRISLIVWLGSVALLISGFFFSVPESELVRWYLFLTIFITISSFRLFPVYFIKLINIISPVVRKRIGNLPYVSLQNIVPQIKKNTFATLLISVMVMIVCIGSVFFETVTNGGEEYIRQTYATNINVSLRDQSTLKIDPEQLKREVTSLTGIDEIVVVNNYNNFEVTGKEGVRHSFVYKALDLQMLDHMNIMEVPNQEQLQSHVIISENFAAKNGYRVGDLIAAEMYLNEEQGYEVVDKVIVSAIYEKLPGSYADMYVDLSATSFIQPHTQFDELWLNAQDETLVLEQLQELQQMYPAQLRMNSLSKELAISDKMKDERWSMFVATLTIMMVSVIMGICNTLFQNIHSNRREYAVMRIIAVTERGISFMITLQFMLYILFGTLLGLILGTLVVSSLSRIDEGVQILINLNLIAWNIAILIVVCMLMLIPFIRHIRKQSLISELNSN